MIARVAPQDGHNKPVILRKIQGRGNLTKSAQQIIPPAKAGKPIPAMILNSLFFGIFSTCKVIYTHILQQEQIKIKKNLYNLIWDCFRSIIF